MASFANTAFSTDSFSTESFDIFVVVTTTITTTTKSNISISGIDSRPLVERYYVLNNIKDIENIRRQILQEDEEIVQILVIALNTGLFNG